MSGIAKLKDDTTLATGKKNVLEWVMEHEGISGADIDSVSAGTHIPIEINPTSPSLPPNQTIDECILPEPCILHPEKPACTMAKSPSSMVDDALRAEEKLSDDEAAFNRTRGTIMHAIIRTGIRGTVLPTAKAVACALQAEGVGQDRADKPAAEILEEAGKTLADPFIIRLMESHETRSEWEIEDATNEGRVRSGIIDLAAFNEDTWWICDFKTSRPEDSEPIEAFVSHERKLYRPQLEAYREMLARLKDIPESQISVGIYLTAFLRWEEL